ncbi:hypothetical protein H6801_01750 [Candidatus Nomurabacteria bacterium]|nr:hypothetical protein [Candidatus Nomurabacteria bacterium]
MSAPLVCELALDDWQTDIPTTQDDIVKSGVKFRILNGSEQLMNSTTYSNDFDHSRKASDHDVSAEKYLG